MLTCQMSLWPFGDETREKRILTINLANIGQSSSHGYSYAYTVDEPDPLVYDPIKHDGFLDNYNRNNSAFRMLEAIVDDYYKNDINDKAYTDRVAFIKEQTNDVFERLRNKTIN